MSILRFKVQQKELQEKMIIFSELNKFNDNSIIKENFDIWTQENKDLIETEYEFLRRNEYNQDIKDKLFKSIKYYYIKKLFKEKPQHKPIEKPAKVFISSEILDEMKKDIKNHFSKNPSFKPSETFVLFRENYIFMDEVPLKKAYKNQYFQIKNKK